MLNFGLMHELLFLIFLYIINREMRFLREEARALRGEVERITLGKKEMTARLESLTKDILRACTENEQILVLTDDLGALSEELMHARSLSPSPRYVD
jgi:hypothetical protein